MDVDVEEDIDLHLKVDELDKRSAHKAERMSPSHSLPPIDESSGSREVTEFKKPERASASGAADAPASSVDQVVQKLQRLSCAKSGKTKSVQRTRHLHKPSDTELNGWNWDDAAHQKDSLYPIFARGLFTRQLSDGNYAIVIRGYDKFYNTGEVAATTWDTMAETTTGPYEVTLKETGCILFMAALEGHLLVTSKFVVGNSRRESAFAEDNNEPGPVQPVNQKPTCQYVRKGEEWALRHIRTAGKTKEDLVSWLSQHNVTAVFQLVDEDVGEQLFEQPNRRKGLYVHGINSNTTGFHTWNSSRVSDFAAKFGFHFNAAPVLQSLAEVKVLADKCAKNGKHDGRFVEGFVVRCRLKQPLQQQQPKQGSHAVSAEPTDQKSVGTTSAEVTVPGDNSSQSFFFKIKFNIPYLLFREWREITKKVLTGKPAPQPEHPVSQKYVTWVQEQVKANPQMFEQYLDNKGLVPVRDAFLQSMHLPTDPVSLASALAVL